MNQAQILADHQVDDVSFEPVGFTTYIGIGTLYECPDGSEVWYIFRPEKYGLRRFEENTPEVWEKLWQ